MAVQRSISIYYPAVAQSEIKWLILNGLQLLDLPKRRFQYIIRQSLNNSRHHSRFMTYPTPLIIAILLTSLFAGCSKRPTHGVLTSSASSVIEPGVSIGPVRSGMTMEQVVTELGEPDKKHDGILMYRNLSVFPSKEGFVGHVFCFDSGTNGSSTEGFAGHTKEGIGIGSSRADVITAYGEPTATKHENVDKENEVMIYESLGLHFHIRNGKVYLIAVYFKI